MTKKHRYPLSSFITWLSQGMSANSANVYANTVREVLALVYWPRDDQPVPGVLLEDVADPRIYPHGRMSYVPFRTTAWNYFTQFRMGFETPVKPKDAAAEVSAWLIAEKEANATTTFERMLAEEAAERREKAAKTAQAALLAALPSPERLSSLPPDADPAARRLDALNVDGETPTAILLLAYLAASRIVVHYRTKLPRILQCQHVQWEDKYNLAEGLVTGETELKDVVPRTHGESNLRWRLVVSPPRIKREGPVETVVIDDPAFIRLFASWWKSPQGQAAWRDPEAMALVRTDTTWWPHRTMTNLATGRWPGPWMRDIVVEMNRQNEEFEAERVRLEAAGEMWYQKPREFLSKWGGRPAFDPLDVR